MVAVPVELRRDADGRLTPAPPAGDIIDTPPFPIQAKVELQNETQRKNLYHATHTIRAKRERVTSELENWQEIRRAGEAIKNRMGRHMDFYLQQLEDNLTKAGSVVHWARDAEEANKIIVDLVKATGVNEVTKVKSMATQEIDMNEALEAENIAAWETDLAELIVQLGHDRPSHILVPAIHRNRTEVRDIFTKEMGIYGKPAPEDLDDQPVNLAAASRQHLREKFLRTSVAISGANFAIAETGTLVVMESEGNGRMNLTLPQTLISVVGIEKVLPTFDDLEVFLQLLPRSSTGEREAPYVSCWTGPTPGDGPQNVHVVLIDNGRTNVLADPKGRAALRCIRCSACLNICPVYEKVGGHAYGSVYPGPIGTILNPQLRGTDSPVDRALPFASTLCGACNDVCPVKIPIADILVQQRRRIVEAKKAEAKEQGVKGAIHLEPAIMAGASWVFADSRRLAAVDTVINVVGHIASPFAQKIGNLPIPGASKWLRARDVPMVPSASFRAWWRYRGEYHETHKMQDGHKIAVASVAGALGVMSAALITKKLRGSKKGK